MRTDPKPGRAAIALAVALTFLAPAAGCGGGDDAPSSAAAGPAIGPRGGPLVPLPDGAGFVEVVCEYPKTARPGLDGRIVAYFLGPDAKAPLATAPTDVSVRLRTPDAAEPVELPLKPDPTPKEPARFASAVGPYGVDRPIGELKATVGGNAFAGAFVSPR